MIIWSLTLVSAKNRYSPLNLTSGCWYVTSLFCQKAVKKFVLYSKLFKLNRYSFVDKLKLIVIHLIPRITIPHRWFILISKPPVDCLKYVIQKILLVVVELYAHPTCNTCWVLRSNVNYKELDKWIFKFVLICDSPLLMIYGSTLMVNSQCKFITPLRNLDPYFLAI